MFVEGEEEFEAVAVGGEGLGTIGAVNGKVEVGVRVGEGGGHGEGVVEVGEGDAGVEEGLGSGGRTLDF